jgi:hypothetical protein
MPWQTSAQILITTATEENSEERRFGAATPNRILVHPEQRPLFLSTLLEGEGHGKTYVGIKKLAEMAVSA